MAGVAVAEETGQVVAGECACNRRLCNNRDCRTTEIVDPGNSDGGCTDHTFDRDQCVQEATQKLRIAKSSVQLLSNFLCTTAVSFHGSKPLLYTWNLFFRGANDEKS